MSLERVVPDELRADETTGQATLALHLERYRFAARELQPGTLLDLACGVGYGARELMEQAGDRITQLMAVDVSPDAIALAEHQYAHPRIRYEVAEALAFHSEVLFDTIVSLETIEHLETPAAFLNKMVGLLKPGGRLICSVPVTPSVDVNPYHRHDFTSTSFRALGQSLQLRERKLFWQEQKFNPFAIVQKKEQRLQDLRKNLLGYYLKNPGAFFKRIHTTLRHGFANHYLTVVWEKEGADAGRMHP